jgi:CDP-glucose 4,6-dehydratase
VTSSLSEALGRTCPGRRVLVTGSTGFVGSWLSYILSLQGAEVIGLSLPVPRDASFGRAEMAWAVQSVIGDVTNYPSVLAVMREYEPNVVFHLAAQALVLPSYEQPLSTFSTNVMGTANVLEALRVTRCAACCVVITSDKCYAAPLGRHASAHSETDPLGGDDPYSASKAAAEIVSQSYWRSFGGSQLPPMATARAGNILGGGDWAPGRLVPDWARSARDGRPLSLRHPDAVRPWQHVLDAIAGYVLLAGALLADATAEYAGPWNFGPSERSAVTVRQLVDMLQNSWNGRTGGPPVHVLAGGNEGSERPRERNFLALDSSRAQAKLAWERLLDLDGAVDWTTEWYAAAFHGGGTDATAVVNAQIARYLELSNESGTAPN